MDDDGGSSLHVCRVCRSGPEPGQPLFHPCRCSGSIRHVHQDCLLAWLQASRKRSCETCGATFRFVPVYSPSRPASLPYPLLLLRLAQRALQTVLVGLRAVLAGTVWLAIVPWMSIWTLRFYLALGNTVAWTLAGKGERMPERFGVAGGGLKPATRTSSAAETLVTAALDGLAELATNDTGLEGGSLAVSVAAGATSVLSGSFLPSSSALSPASASPSFASSLPFSDPASSPASTGTGRVDRPSIGQLLLTLVTRDLFPGQQLIAGVVLTLLAGFLLREWAANARLPEAEPEPEVNGGEVAEGVRDGEAERAAGVQVVEQRLLERRAVLEQAIEAGRAEQQAAREAEAEAALARADGDDAPRGMLDDLPDELFEVGDINAPVTVERGDDAEGAEDDEERLRVVRRARARFLAGLEPTVAVPASPDSFAGETAVVLDAAGSVEEPAAATDKPSSSASNSLVADGNHEGDDNDAAEPSQRPLTSRSSSTRPVADPLAPPYATTAVLPAILPSPPPSPLSPSSDSLPSSAPADAASTSAFAREAGSDADADAETDGDGDARADEPTTLGQVSLAAAASETAGVSAGVEQGDDGLPSAQQAMAEVDGRTDAALAPSLDDFVADDNGIAAEDVAAKEAARNAGFDDNDGDGDDSGDDEWEDVDEVVVPAVAGFPPAAPGRLRPPQAAADARGPNPPPLMPLGLFRPVEADEGAGVGGLDDDVEGRADEVAEDEDEDERLGRDGDDGGEEDEDEEDDEEVEDPANAALLQEEIDGLLEAAGLRGPMTGLLQNTTIITVVVSFFCALAIFLPLVLGKTVLLVDLRAVAKLTLVPIRLIRLTTDPAVGFLVELARSRQTAKLEEATEGSDELALSARVFEALAGRFETHMPASVGAMLGFLPLASIPGVEKPPSNSSTSSVLTTWASSAVDRLSSDDASSLGHALAAVGRTAHDGWQAAAALPSRLTQADDVGLFSLSQGDTVADRVLAVAVGYLVLAGAMGVVFRLRVRWARIVQTELQPAVTVVKLGVFMLIELVLFPFFCGALLHVSALPLLVDRPTLADLRILDDYPIVALGQHVLLGTIFMFGFANLLAFGRTALRPGVFFFIRDPSDPAFNPVNDILFKRTWPQLKKLLISAGMYATMLVSCVGLVGCTLRLLTPRGVGLPLRWGGYPPLTEIPLDLLFIHLGLPLLVGRFHPLARLKRALIAWLSATVEALRLASYFFDAPEPVAWVNGSDDGSDIEVTLRPPPAAAPDMRDRTDTPAKQAVDRLVGWLAPFGRRDFMEGVGGWARVPAVDHLRILPARRMFVRLDDDHAPLNAEELRLLVAINKKAVDAGRDPAADFGVVWLPGHVRSRIYLLLGALWASCLAVAALAVGIVGLGRLMLRLLILGGEKAHDGYALLAGSTVLAGCVEVGLTTEIALRRWSLAQQVAKRRPRPFIRRTTLARRARFFATGAFASVVLVIVVPLVVGLVVETALLLPFRSSAIDPAVIHLAEVWALGALVLSCLVRIRPVLPPVAVLRELDLAYGHHRFRWSAKRLVRRLLGPLLGLAAAAISAPWAAAALCSLGSNDVARNARLSRFAHPAALLGVGGYFAARHAWVALEAWVGKLHDREYLVSMRLRNQGPSDDNGATSTAQPMAIPADMVGLLL